MQRVVCDRCSAEVECYPHPGTWACGVPVPSKGLHAVLLLDPPHELGDVFVTTRGTVEFPRDPARLRDEGVPLRRNHDESCPRPKPEPRKRVWTKKGWRMR